MKSRGQLIILSGPSGVGKSTIVRLLMEQYPNAKFSVSATTREMRPGEQDGVSYFFVSRERFEEMIAAGELLEHAEYAGNYYGTPVKPIDEALELGYDILLDIEVQGAAQIRAKRPDAVSVFIAAPSFAELERRLRGRGDTSEDKILVRLATAKEEYRRIPEYDYLLVSESGRPETAAEELMSILRAARCRTEFRLNQLETSES